MPILIREAISGDAAGIAHVHVKSWQSTYAGIMPDALLADLSIPQRAARWERLLATLNPDQRVFVAEESGQIVGFASGGAEQTGTQPGFAETYAIYLLAEH